jgi:hypothetical protein
MNKSPHVVGGGLGTLREKARADWERKEAARKREENDRLGAENRRRMARLAKAAK